MRLQRQFSRGGAGGSRGRLGQRHVSGDEVHGAAHGGLGGQEIVAHEMAEQACFEELARQGHDAAAQLIRQSDRQQRGLADEAIDTVLFRGGGLVHAGEYTPGPEGVA